MQYTAIRQYPAQEFSNESGVRSQEFGVNQTPDSRLRTSDFRPQPSRLQTADSKPHLTSRPVNQFTNKQISEQTNRPEAKFSTGAIAATVWKNQGKSKTGQPTEYRTITLERRYQKDNEWKSTHQLRVNDLPKAALVIQKAYEYLLFKDDEEQQ